MSTPMPGAGSPLEDADTAGALLLPDVDVTTPEAAVPAGRRRSGGFREVARRYRRNKLAVLGLLVVAALAVVAVLEPWITPYDPREQNLFNTLAPPSADHWFGTDVLGRDLYSGILHGTRLAMGVSVATVFLSLLIGVALGALAGFKGGWWDAVIGRAIDVLLAFPLLVGAILVVRAAGGGLVSVVVALVALGWMTTARLARGQVLALREAEYVEAARSIGAGNGRIVLRHILPNAVAPVLVYSFTNIGVVVVALASLSYLGVGVPADVPEWGRLISQATPFLRVPGKEHLWLAPSSAIVLTTLAFAFVADGLRDALDPRLRGG